MLVCLEERLTILVTFNLFKPNKLFENSETLALLFGVGREA